MQLTRLRRAALLTCMSFSLSGCSIIFGIIDNNKAKKAEEEAQAAKAAELAKAKAELEKMRESALDAGATPKLMWDYGLALATASQSEEMGVDPAWTTELETALSQRIEGEGGLTTDNAYLGYALSQAYAASDRADESATLLLELVKVGGEGPVTPLEVFDAVNSYPATDVTNAAILEMCPLLRPQIEENVTPFVSACVSRAGGDITKLSWEGVLADLESYARSSYARGPANGTFTFHSKVKSYKRSFWALGVVENTSGVFIENPKVTAVLLDKDGAELGSFSGYAMIDEVAPGVKAPVSVLVNDPPKFEDVRYEFTAEQADYLSAPVPGLRVEALKPRRDRFGWKTEGKVISEASQSAAFVKIIVQAFDKDGKLVGASYTYADGDKLEPGGEARWKTTSMDVASKPETFEYTVTARVAD